MYPSSASSSSHRSLHSSGLIRYGSAPGSLLTSAVDSLVSTDREFSPLGSHHIMPHQYFSGDSSSESTCKVAAPPDHKEAGAGGPAAMLQRSYGFSEMPVAGFSTASSLKGGGEGGGGGGSAPSLIRHSSSPAGFLNQLTADNLTRGTGNYSSQGGCNGGHGISRLKSQLSFKRQDSLSQISEVSENMVDGISSDNGHRNATHSYATASFPMDAWDNTNTIVFSTTPNKRAKNINGDILNSLSSLEPQFSLPQTSLEMAAVEKLLQVPEDSVPCKVRAKRGCATHPRSIAERERRTRISGKLKKLQDLVPNMDKQTSYADMLDLAVQHIKGLQNEVQKLNKELENCTCGCKQAL
ncbi:hypothetical protein VitviT2T_007332 [Vitis vinifera]|uniref:BHLH domain-containing protein n=2 Tax=Vitis vinifera TaxID=29760 RepID=A0ABY9BZ75_VITVI|nr:transcription factor bHLH128 isoform X2 [Vitis vinifera]WJZ87992.1 hypothetical protein VitviT2T_007332 [Vitis vinifera]|eukprot:XP_010650469.1 PREDICTED: transcription factor bHLH128 isoform X2 [Vitis vinifera]